jgi:uncharacterized protein DUF3455
MTQIAIAFLFASLASAAAAAELPEAIVAPGELAVMQVHAEGAQIYECKTDAGGHLSWQFREPIASLIQDGKTIGRHYAGPTWAIGDSIVTGKAAGRAPGAGPKDIPWLRLDVTARKGGWPLSDVTTVQRINTVGGALEGDCPKAGDMRSEPYSADYVFLKRTN